MADENANAAASADLNMEEGGDEGAPAAKKGGGAGFIVGLLKYIAIGLGAIILIVVISFVVAKLATKNTSSSSAMELISDDYKVKREPLDWYSSIEEVRAKTNDNPAGTVTVKVVLGYKKDDKAVSTEITSRNIELIDFLRRYFTEKTMLELKPRNEDKLKIELRNAINDEILSTSKIKDIAFTKFDVLEP